MKKAISFLLFIVLGSSLSAQDQLIFRSGDSLEVKVLEIGISEVKYRKWSNQEGPLYVILKEDIRSIQFANGEIEKFKVAPPPIVIYGSGSTNTAVSPNSRDFITGFGLVVLGPTGVLSAELGFMLNKNIELSFGAGIRGAYGGLRYHFLKDIMKVGSLYTGTYVNYTIPGYSFARPNLLIPFGFHYLSPLGFYVAPEFEVMLNDREGLFPFVGLRTGVRFR